VREFLDDCGVIGGHFGSEHGDVRFEIGNVTLTQSREAADAIVDASDFCLEATDPLLVCLLCHGVTVLWIPVAGCLEADTF
jgi:hypothetical protein